MDILYKPWEILYRPLSDKQKILLRYWIRFGRFPDLKNPVTYTEKIQARKLYNRDPRLPLCADKVLVKDFVSQKLGAEWVIPTLFNGPHLPPRSERTWGMPFVIKANNGSGWNIFVRNEAERDWKKIEKKIECWLGKKYGLDLGEWHYSEIKPQVLVEPFISGNNRAPSDYKIFVFEGVPACIQMDIDREKNHKRVFFDTAWNKLNVFYVYPHETQPIPKPASLDKMLKAAAILGKDFSFVRVDFYEIGERPYFGEMTFYPTSGFEKFDPPDFDKALGEMWKQKEKPDFY
jgi:TupA-like ATPgrasp